MHGPHLLLGCLLLLRHVYAAKMLLEPAGWQQRMSATLEQAAVGVTRNALRPGMPALHALSLSPPVDQAFHLLALRHIQSPLLQRL